MRQYAGPIFQHRHYAAIAKLLSLAQPDDSPEAIKEQFADLFKRDNWAFQWDRFMAAANGKPLNGRDER
jgi:hypothetical protein